MIDVNKGYTTQDIADITDPAIISLSRLPNYLQIAPKPANRVTLLITVFIAAVTEDSGGIWVTTPAGTVFKFPATEDQSKAYGNVFFIAQHSPDTAENLRQAMLSNDWISANFNITIPGDWSNANPVNGQKLYIESKGSGSLYNITIESPGDPGGDAFVIDPVRPTSQANDSICGEDSNAALLAEVYTGSSVILGQNDKPDTVAKLGQLATSLRKTYTGHATWFNVNAPFSNITAHKVPPLNLTFTDWFDAGTAVGYRVIAKRAGGNTSTFYYSRALWVLNGGARLTDAIDLSGYVYSNSTVKLLSRKPLTKHMQGQRQYLNFILSRTEPDEHYERLQVCYRSYTAGGTFLGVLFDQALIPDLSGVVNTCSLRLDEIVAESPTVGLITVSLALGTTVISDTLSFEIVSPDLHVLNYFSFVNSLGGWETFNFDALSVGEVKPTSNTFYSSVTPAFSKGDSVETVASVSLDTPMTVDSAPVTDEVAEWLKELAASSVVLDQQGRYVVKDDFTLKLDSKSFNMQVCTMKYHLSDTYTND